MQKYGRVCQLFCFCFEEVSFHAKRLHEAVLRDFHFQIQVMPHLLKQNISNSSQNFQRLLLVAKAMCHTIFFLLFFTKSLAFGFQLELIY
jgi:hypothetical protein